MTTTIKSMQWTFIAAMGLVVTGCGPAIDDSILGTDGACVDIAETMFGEVLPAENRVHQSFASYVKSKVSLEPLVFHQYTVRQEGIAVPVGLSCKFKSAESLSKSFGRELHSKTCGEINQSITNKVLGKLALEGKTPSWNLIFDKDMQATRGTQYVDPWPFQTLYQQADELHVRAKEMFVSSESWAPLPANFKGVQYCHLLSADYLEAVLSGALDAPTLTSGE